MKRVIVVDDEPITRMDLRGMLGDLGFEVAGEAGDGFDAVEVCRRLQPDVVLMDVKMPVFDGINAAETILQQDLAGCVVLLTAYGDREIIDRASAAGVTGYIVKPVEERLLLPTIEVALAQSQRLRQSREEDQLVLTAELRLISVEDKGLPYDYTNSIFSYTANHDLTRFLTIELVSYEYSDVYKLDESSYEE